MRQVRPNSVACNTGGQLQGRYQMPPFWLSIDWLSFTPSGMFTK